MANGVFSRRKLTDRISWLTIAVLLLVLFGVLISALAGAQTFNFNTWSSGSFSYSNVQGGNTMTVTYSESANNRGNTLASTTCFGNNTTTPAVPFYYNSSTMNIANYSSGSCYCSSSAAQSGLVMAANWSNNNAANYEQIVISFANPVCSPVSFNIWDINQDIWSGDGSSYFTDKIDISATDASATPIPAANITIGNCGGNSVSTSGNTKTITANGTGCGCGATSVSISSQVKTITIKYYPGGSTYSSDPWSQYVIISNITATAPPTAGITAAPLACGSNSTTLTASTNAGSPTYLWTGPGGSTINSPNSSSTVVTGAGTYTLTINPGGCSSSATYTLTPTGSVPNLTAAATQTVTCTTPTISASSSDPVNYSWSGPGIVSGGSTATPTVNAAGNYTVTVTNPSTGCTNSTVVAVTLNNTPPTAVAGSPLSLNCTTTSGTISVSTNAASPSYSWTGPGIVSGGTSASPTVNAAGTYNVTVTNTANGCTNTTSVAVSASSTAPVVTPGPPVLITCTNSVGIVTASTNISNPQYSWSGPAVVANGNTANATVDADGTYTVTVTDPSNGCTGTATVNVSTNITAPNISVGPGQTLSCTSTSVTISGSSSTPNAQFAWTDSNGNPAGTTPSSSSTSVSVADSYMLTVTNPVNGCTSTSLVTVTANASLPQVTMGPSPSLSCLITTATISASSSTPNATFAWTDTNGDPAGTTPGASSTVVNAFGTYTVTVTDPLTGCFTSVNVNVVIDNVQPDITVPATVNIGCNPATVTLTGTSTLASATYSWTDSNGDPAGSAPSSSSTLISATGTYTITVTNPVNGCVNSATVLVNPSVGPNADAGSDLMLSCTSNSIQLDGTGSDSGTDISYNWAGPGVVSGGNTTTPTINIPGNYTIVVTDLISGCFSMDEVVVNPDNTGPNANGGSSQSITCIVSQVTLDGSSSTGSNLSYEWTGPGISGSSTGTTVNVSTPGTYELLITDQVTGCMDSVNVIVLADTIPPLANAGNDIQVSCITGTGVLSATPVSGGNTYSWSGPGIVAGSNSPSVTVNFAGEYIVEITGANGCTDSDTVSVTGTQGPDASFIATSQSNIVPAVVTTTNTSTGTSLSYNWNFGNGETSTDLNSGTTYTSAGNYLITLIVVDGNNCSDTATTVIEVLGLPIDVPNGFTPNGDGSNDYFVIVGLEQYPNNEITIFNRWGDQVYFANPYMNDWYGKSNNKSMRINGDQVVDGTYFFILDLGDGSKPINGFVELKTK